MAEILLHHVLKVKKSKFTYAKQQLLYVGHVISVEWVSMDMSKIALILKWQQQHCDKELWSFLDYGKFIKGME
jgi:hypothetical protein